MPLKLKDPEFFRRYFYMVSVVQQEFYKGDAPLLHSRLLQCFDTESAGIQLSQLRKGASAASTSVQVSLAPVSRIIFLHALFILNAILSLAIRRLFGQMQQQATTRSYAANALPVYFILTQFKG